MKTILKAVTPPVVWSALKAASRRQTFPSWEAACAAAGTYDDKDLNRFRKARACVADATATPLPMLLCGLKDGAVVTDYGGAFGDMGRAVTALFPSVSYKVVETEGVVSIAEDVGPVTFHRDIPAACDVFFSSGTLQCLRAPYDVVAHAFETARGSVAFWRNNFSERETFMVHKARLFENGTGPIPSGYIDYKVSYPCRTIQEVGILEIAERAGFRLAFRALDDSGIMDASSYGANLVFSRLPPPARVFPATSNQ